MTLRRKKNKYSDKVLSQQHFAHHNSTDMVVDRTQPPFAFLEVGR